MPTETGDDVAVAVYVAETSTSRLAPTTRPFTCARVSRVMRAVGSEIASEMPRLADAASESAVATLTPVALTWTAPADVTCDVAPISASSSPLSVARVREPETLANPPMPTTEVCASAVELPVAMTSTAEDAVTSPSS